MKLLVPSPENLADMISASTLNKDAKAPEFAPAVAQLDRLAKGKKMGKRASTTAKAW